MPRTTTHIYAAVRRPRAENYLLITLLSFAASVTLTRLFLEITGYPQLGSKELHIAHLLWGGLFLFIAALLPLLLANRWVYFLTAFISGVGVGLFIDEVGKFITQNNDYFYPAAAPIIYAVFLLTVLLYVRVRRKPASNSRQQLYEILEGLEEVLDHDLDQEEKLGITTKLRQIIQDDTDQDFKTLASALLNYIENGQIEVIPETKSTLDKWVNKLQDIEDKYVSKSTLRAVLAGSLLALGIFSLWRFFPLLAIGLNSRPLQDRLSNYFQSGLLTTSAKLDWFSVWLVLEGSVGILLILSAIFLIFGADQRGVNLSFISLLLSLTVVDLLLFYFDQFSSIFIASIQLILLLGVIHYRKRFLLPIIIKN
jgi:hypothetical protein